MAPPRLRLITDATAEPLSLADAKLYARVDQTAEDSMIASLITAARRRIERDTGLALLTQTWVALWDRWPHADNRGLATPWWDGVREMPINILAQTDVIEIHKRPFACVTQIQLRSAYGDYTTVDPSIYFTERSNYEGRVIRVLGTMWPIVVMAPSGAINVTFTCGFDAIGLPVPDDLVTAMRILVKHWYDNRDMVTDGRFGDTPHGYGELLAAWRNLRL